MIYNSIKCPLYKIPFVDNLNNKTKKNFELVITRYNEDISWSDNYIDYRTIYNKGNENVSYQYIKKQNIGRDGETPLYHIINNYNNLSDVTFFCQGAINDRNDQIISMENWRNYIKFENNHLYGFHERNDLPNKNENFCNYPIKFGDLYYKIFDKSYKANFKWIPGMWISVHKNIIKSVPLEIYKKMYNLFYESKCNNDPTQRIPALHIERLLYHVFNDLSVNKIFLLWYQGWNNCPLLQKNVLYSWKINNPTWNIILLDKNNIFLYLDDIDYLYNSKKNITVQALSDIIRLNILNKYGGVWADATLLCMQSLNHWIYEVINKTGFWMYHGTKKPLLNNAACSWFLISKKNNYIIKTWSEECNKFWNNNNSTDNYFWMDSLFNELFLKNENFKNLWLKTPYLSCETYGSSHCLKNNKLYENDNKLKNTLTIKTPYVLKFWNTWNNWNNFNSEEYKNSNGFFALELSKKNIIYIHNYNRD